MKSLNEKATLTAYSSDASIYGIEPKAVIKITNSRDIIQAVEYARANRLSITPRGGGTGLAGGALGTGLILDFAGFNKVIAVDPIEKMVLTQVGIVYDELNMILKKYGLFFPPDPSSGDSCQIGGMLGNNSSGSHSLRYGLTSDYVEELSVVDHKGRLLYLKKLEIGSAKFDAFLNDYEEYRKVLDILTVNSRLIKEKWPRLKKNSAGYNLLQVVSDLERGIFNIPALIVGSEGTLAVIVSTLLKLAPIPGGRLTVRLYFESLKEAGWAVERILRVDPCALEIVDGATLDLIGRKRFDIPSGAAAMLLVEFDGNTERKKEDFLELADKLTLAGPIDFAHDIDSAESMWEARKAIVPTLYRHHQTKRPVALIEDISLPSEKMPDFIEFATDLLKRHNLTFGMYGHIGDGNLHIRPLFDLKNEDELVLAQKIYNDVYEKVIDLGGSTTAEHAVGRLRAPFLKRLYGNEIYEIFEKIKNTLDPEGIMSPGSVISAAPFTDAIDYKKLISFCAACGKCNGYCPAYHYFRREDFSPRGWLRILNQSGESRKKLDEFLSFCLNCKNCATVCPAGVDIASEIMKYRSDKTSLLSGAVAKFTDIEPLFRLSIRFGKIMEPVRDSMLGRRLAEILGKRSFGLDSTVQFPRLAKKSIQERFKNRLSNKGQVAFFHGCADNLLESEVGDAVFSLFDFFKIDLKIPRQKCCGLPYEVYGLYDNLLKKARYNIDHLSNFDAVITGCASCLHRLQEYVKLFDDDRAYQEKAAALSEKCHDISQYLNRSELDYSGFKLKEKMLLTYHNPCHLRAAGLQKEPIKLVSKFNDIEILHPDYADHCCAQAGSYGFTHYQESKGMFRKKKEEYYEIGAKYIMTSCPACKMKIQAEMGGNFKVAHPVEILNMILNNKV